MWASKYSGVFLILAMSMMSACATTPTLGGSKGNTVTGAVGGATKEGENTALESCEVPLGTLAVTEDQQATWWNALREHQLGSTIPVIRLMIQQSNCFVVIERGIAMRNMMQERMLERSGEMRRGSGYGKGQMVAADYTVSPKITFSARHTPWFGLITMRSNGRAVGSYQANEASTMLLLIDNRTGVQVAAAMGSAKNFDWGMFGDGMRSGLGAVGGGYGDTAQGKVVVAAFADSYNNMVKALRNYRVQHVKGGLGTGGQLGVQSAPKPPGVKPATRPRVKRPSQASHGSTAGSYLTTITIYIRSSAGGKVLGTLPLNTHVAPSGKKDGKWWEVEANGVTGWVHSRYLTKYKKKAKTKERSSYKPPMLGAPSNRIGGGTR